MLEARSIIRLIAAVLAGPTLFVAGGADAHGLNPAVAYMNNPTGVGNVVDDSILLTWIDADRSIPTGTATVDFHYTNAQPPTFLNGERHPALTGPFVVEGLIEKEMPNEYVWDTSNIPAGSYLLWSEVIEPPEENMAIKIIEFSPGIITIAHPGDPIFPAVYLKTPTSPFQFADKTVDIEYLAFNPDGTSRVRLEAGMDPDGEDFMLVADDLPATDEGSYTWDTSGLAEGDWILRATITDGDGRSFYHYARYFLLVTHTVIRPDAGVIDAGDTNDGGQTRDGGAGDGEPPDDSSCTCSGTHREGSGALMLFGLLALVAIRSSRSI